MLYSKAKLASACGGIIYFLSYVPYMYVAIREEVAHDKITAFEKCIAVSWLQLLGRCLAPGLLQAPHAQYTGHQAVTKPWASLCLYEPTPHGALEGSPESLGPPRAGTISTGLGWGSTG